MLGLLELELELLELELLEVTCDTITSPARACQ